MRPSACRFLGLGAAVLACARLPIAAPAAPAVSSADRALAACFGAETARLQSDCLADARTLGDWESRRGPYREQLLEMLGLWPLPERTDLQPQVTGRLEQPEFAVENLCFQSLPGLYVTGNLYLPKGATNRSPAVLYVCGHSEVVKNGVRYGNKTAYHHHGVWFARHGYVCLTIDTAQLGELAGIHHGTYREKMWWWNSRGYTPAGVETWNSMRALDYLQTRPEVDGRRLGVTGRSGGGAYSWWLAAVDERIRVAAPVAGITDLQNHVVDGAVEGHCDCMFMVNTYRWDFAQVAALVAPRPLLIANSDKDTIFPLDGVVRIHERVRRVYALHGATNRLGLLITEGPHSDTQDLQLPVFRWFNRFLKEQDTPIEVAALKRFQPEDLRVLNQAPAGARNGRIHETFVPQAGPFRPPGNPDEWRRQSEAWRASLIEKSFRGWPAEPGPAPGMRLAAQGSAQGVRLRVCSFASQNLVELRLYVAEPARGRAPRQARLEALDAAGWQEWLRTFGSGFPGVLTQELAGAAGLVPDPEAFARWAATCSTQRTAFAWVTPRGLGLDQWTGDERKQTQIRRRFMLLGQTLDGMRAWDIRRATRAFRGLEGVGRLPLRLQAAGDMGVNALYAAVFEPEVAGLDLAALPASHMQGPDYLNVLRILDLPQAVALAASRVPVTLRRVRPGDWEYALETARRLQWPPGRLGVFAE